MEEVAEQLGKIYEPSEAKNIALLLFEDKYEVTRSELLAGSEKQIDEETLASDLNRLLNHEPIQYVTGVVYFYNRKFKIRNGALIPRPETEELVDLIVTENVTTKPRVLDVGTGSGCISISLEQELNGDTFGIDISEEALKVATENAQLHSSSVEFSICNVLSKKPAVGTLDILVSNPPYIPNSEQNMMQANVLEFEPKEALFVPDNDPLIFYERISKLGLKLLRSGGKLYFEIHENFGGPVKSMVEEVGYTDVKIHQDMQGKDRILSAIR